MSDRGESIRPKKDTVSDWRDRRIAKLKAELEQARAESATLKARIAELERRLAEMERTGKRQATLFARDEHKADPKKPGRKAGQGLFSYRAKPTADEVDESKKAQWDRCPDCGGAVTELKEHEQLCVQRKRVCSAGVSPARAKARSSVAGIAGWRETKILKPMDKAIIRMAASRQAVTKVNAKVAPKM